MFSKISPKTNQEILELFESLPTKELNDPKFVSSVFTFQGRKSISYADEVISRLPPGKKNFLDPFMGSGNFLIAFLKNNKKSVGIELDNYTFFAVKSLLTKANLQKLGEMYKKIEDEIKPQIMYLYETFCPNCHTKLHISKLYFDPLTEEYYSPEAHREIIDGNNIKFIEGHCPKCNAKGKRFDKKDEEKISSTLELDTTRFPKHEFIQNSRINITHDTGADIYDRNFTNRGKYALLLLQNKIKTFPTSIERDILESALVASIALSKICMYGSGTDNLYHVIIDKAQETNVWDVFEKKYNAILSYKKEFNEKENIYADNDNLTLINSDYYSELSNQKYKEKFDVIYTDPPYTDQVPYLEKSQYFRDWINCFYDSSFALTQEMLNSEIVISDAPSRKNKKSLYQYYQDIDKMFSIFYQILTNEGFIILTIKFGKKSFFSDLARFINYARKNGFEYAHKLAINCEDPTIRKQAAFANTITNQYLVFFVKLERNNRYWYIDDQNMDFFIIKTTYKLLVESHKNLTQVVEHVKQRVLLECNYICTSTDLDHIKKIIKENFICDEKSFEVYLDNNKLYIGVEGKNELFIKLYDYIPVIIKRLLEKHSEFVIEDLYFELGSIICDGNDDDLFNQIIDPNGSQNKQIRLYLQYYCDLKDGKYIKKNLVINDTEGRKDLAALEPYEFEDFIKKFLTKKGYKNALRIGGSGDRGVDVQAENIRGNITIVQCKRWIGAVGGEPIQRLHSQMIINDRVDEAICITTSHFSSQGLAEAKATGVKIIDGKLLMAEIELYFPQKYYNSALNF